MCYILAWSLCILHGICYIWLICMVFATFWCFKRSCGSPSNARLHDWPWQPKQRQPRQQAPQSLARIRREPNPSGANGHGNAAKMLVWQGRLEHQVANRIERPTSGNFCTAHCSVCPRISRWRLEPLAPWPSPSWWTSKFPAQSPRMDLQCSLGKWSPSFQKICAGATEGPGPCVEGSLGFHLGFHLRFHVGFHLVFYLGLHLGFHLGFL